MKHLPPFALTTALLLAVGPAVSAAGQELSSSLYETGDTTFADPFADPVFDAGAPLSAGRQSDRRQLSPAIAAASFTAVVAPEPQTFAVHDLVSIIIREETRTAFSSSLETEKESRHEAEVAEFPRLTLSDLLDTTLVPNTFPDGTVKLDLEASREFTGEGDYSNRQTMSARIQATILDVKPNGTVVLEARKAVRSDHEAYTLVAIGVCRVDDITADNTILSTQLADLFVEKQHEGYLKKASEKGPLTNLFDWLLPL